MQQTIRRYGVIAGLVWLVLAVATYAYGKLAGVTGFDYGEVIGYTSMVLTLSVIFLALLHYRDAENDGLLDFKTGMTIGLAISAIAGLVVAAWDYAYTTWLEPNFKVLYAEWSAAQLVKAGKTATEAQAEVKAMMDSFGFFGSNFGMALLMFITVLMLGVVISVVATLLLRRTAAQTA